MKSGIVLAIGAVVLGLVLVFASKSNAAQQQVPLVQTNPSMPGVSDFESLAGGLVTGLGSSLSGLLSGAGSSIESLDGLGSVGSPTYGSAGPSGSSPTTTFVGPVAPTYTSVGPLGPSSLSFDSSGADLYSGNVPTTGYYDTGYNSDLDLTDYDA
jgi:hypothetical protein